MCCETDTCTPSIRCNGNCTADGFGTYCPMSCQLVSSFWCLVLKLQLSWRFAGFQLLGRVPAGLSPSRPGPSRPESQHAGSQQAQQAGSQQSQHTRSQHTGSQQAGRSILGPSRPCPSRPSRPGPSTASRPAPSGPSPSGPGPSGPGPSRPDPSRPCTCWGSSFPLANAAQRVKSQPNAVTPSVPAVWLNVPLFSTFTSEGSKKAANSSYSFVLLVCKRECLQSFCRILSPAVRTCSNGGGRRGRQSGLLVWGKGWSLNP